ncbi:MAG: ABC transporter permease [Methanomicrobiaceae archaeon]|nr:ABC transporter permease [Methanomicrobiaceae archaeon]
MNIRHVGIIAKKELRGLGHERTIVFAILLQLFIAMFSSFLMVGLASMYDPEMAAGYSRARYSIGYAGADSPLVDEFSKRRDLQLYRMDLSEAVAALRERKVSAVIYVPDTPPDAEAPIAITLYTLQNDLQSGIINIKLRELLLGYEAKLREIRAERLESYPISLNFPEARRGSDFFEFVYGLLIPLLVFMPAIISAALIIDLITEEHQRDTLATLLSTPVTFPEQVWGKIAACTVLVPVQAAAWLLLLMANGIAIRHAGAILLLVSVGGLFLILLGALPALHYRERTGAQFIFSTALVVVILGTISLPANPLNLIVLLSVGAAGALHWIVFCLAVLCTLCLAVAVTGYARHIAGVLHAEG